MGQRQYVGWNRLLNNIINKSRLAARHIFYDLVKAGPLLDFHGGLGTVDQVPALPLAVDDSVEQGVFGPLTLGTPNVVQGRDVDRNAQVLSLLLGQCLLTTSPFGFLGLVRRKSRPLVG